MPIDHEVRLGGIILPPGFGDDNRVAFRRANTGVQADFPAVRHQPFGAGEQIFLVLRLGRDAGEAQVVAQFRDEAAWFCFR